MSNQSETCHLAQTGLAVAAGGAQPRGCVWCSNLEGAGRMFLLLAMAGWDKGDLSRTRGFGRVIASPPPQHHDDGGFSLGRELLSLSLLAWSHPAGLSPTPVPLLLLASPGGCIWGNHLCPPAAAGSQGGSSWHGGNLAMMGIQPQTPAGFIPEPPSIPVDTHGQALPHLFPHLPFNSFLHFSSSSINALSSPSPDLSLAVICGYCSKVAAT